jgi:hypothetical protein
MIRLVNDAEYKYSAARYYEISIAEFGLLKRYMIRACALILWWEDRLIGLRTFRRVGTRRRGQAASKKHEPGQEMSDDKWYEITNSGKPYKYWAGSSGEAGNNLRANLFLN